MFQYFRTFIRLSYKTKKTSELCKNSPPEIAVKFGISTWGSIYTTCGVLIGLWSQPQVAIGGTAAVFGTSVTASFFRPRLSPHGINEE